MVLDILQFSAEPLELRAFRVVLYGDVCLEGSLVVEELVFVHFIRAYRRLDCATQVHPRDVAVVIVIREKRIRTPGQKGFECRLARQAGRLAEERGGASPLALVLHSGWHESEAALRGPPPDAEKL